MANNYKALFIGVNEYNDQTFRALNAVVNDVSYIKDIMETYFPINYSQHFIGISRTTKEKILLATSNFLKNSDDNDVLFLYWGGHGLADIDVGYFVASDTNYSNYTESGIAMDDIRNLIDESEARVVIAIFDCCYSGAMARSEGHFMNAIKKAFHIEGNGKIIITSSTDRNESYDLDDQSMGRFSNCFISSMLNKLDQSLEEISIFDIYSDTIKFMKKYNSNDDNKYQIPCLSARIEGEMSLKKKTSLDQDHINSMILPIKSQLQTRSSNQFFIKEELEKIFTKRFMDDSHFKERVEKYIDLPLPAGVARLHKSRYNPELFPLNITWDNWIISSKLSPAREGLFIETDKEIAKKLFEIDREIQVFLKIKAFTEKVYIDDIYLKYNNNDIPTQGLLSQVPSYKIKTNSPKIIYISFSQDSNILFWITMDNIAFFWNIVEDRLIHTTPLNIPNSSVVLLAKAKNGLLGLKIYDKENKKDFLEIFKIENYNIQKQTTINIDIANFVFLNEGNALAIIECDGNITIKDIYTLENVNTYQVLNSKTIYQLFKSNAILDMDISNDDEKIAVLTTSEFIIWNLKKFETISLKNKFNAKQIKFLKQNILDGYSNRSVIQINTDQLEVEPKLFNLDKSNLGSTKYEPVDSTDTSIIGAEKDRYSSTLSFMNKKLNEVSNIFIPDNNSNITAITISPDNKWIAVGLENGDIYLWK